MYVCIYVLLISYTYQSDSWFPTVDRYTAPEAAGEIISIKKYTA
jgi:hypothetical protein